MWSFHPKYLDNVGLSRAINEAVAGYKALIKTGKGYPPTWEKHSQLTRFRNEPTELEWFVVYLVQEWSNRKLAEVKQEPLSNLMRFVYTVPVNKGQLQYEWKHYLNKLKIRNEELYHELKGIITPEPHPLFKTVKGDVEEWERVK